jgi:hypothetical protein
VCVGAQEYALAHFLLLCASVVVVALADLLAHVVQRNLEPDDQHARRAEFRRQLGYIVWTRLQNELMVVSTLVLCAWLAHETGLLDAAAAVSVAWQSEHPSAPLVDRPTGPYWQLERWIPWMLSCHPRMPRNPTTVLHLAQDVTVALLTTKVLFFAFLWVSLTTQIQWLSTYERLEAGGAPRNPPESFAARQLDAMREQLLAAARSDKDLSERVQRSAEIRQSVDDGHLYVSGFLAETTHAHLEHMCDFASQTWMLVLLYVSLTAASLYMCVEYNQLSILLDLVWYTGSLYLGYRLLLHAAILRSTAREIEAERISNRRLSGEARAHGWPAEWIDWLLFPIVGPGVTGFVPFRSKPSELVGMRCLQAMLWVNLYRLGEYATDPFRRSHDPRVFGIELLVHVVPKVVCLLVWGMWLLPGMLEVFSLPPYLNSLEHSLLLHTLRQFPNGLPADDLMVGPTAEPLEGDDGAAAEAGRARRAVPPPRARIAADASQRAISSYVMMKARQTEGSPWLPDLRAMRSAWRQLWGLPPLRNPSQRLADHFQWINADDADYGMGVVAHTPKAPNGSNGASSPAHEML